jgi:5'-methylthioadenosine phosphorylase
VVCDQLVDRTSGRVQTYYETGAVHVPFADPYCPDGRRVAVRLAGEQGWPVVDGGTMVVVEGPRFSTRAESQWFGAQGWSVVNMTGHPEAVLARELALCYTPDRAGHRPRRGVEGGASVTQAEVFRVFKASTDRLRGLLLDVAAALPQERSCPCGSSLAGTGVEDALP